jgi:hypothetical protein
MCSGFNRFCCDPLHLIVAFGCNEFRCSREILPRARLCTKAWKSVEDVHHLPVHGGSCSQSLNSRVDQAGKEQVHEVAPLAWIGKIQLVGEAAERSVT